MPKRKKSKTWREVSLRWRMRPNKKAAAEWLEGELEAEVVSLEVVRKIESEMRDMPKRHPDYSETLYEYAKEKLAALRAQSYGERGRVPPEVGETRPFKVLNIDRPDSVPCIRLPLHRIKVKKKEVDVTFFDGKIQVGG